MNIVMDGKTLDAVVDAGSEHASAARLNVKFGQVSKSGAPLTLDGYVCLHVRKRPRVIPKRLWDAILRRALVLESFGPYQPRELIRRNKTL